METVVVYGSREDKRFLEAFSTCPLPGAAKLNIIDTNVLGDVLFNRAVLILKGSDSYSDLNIPGNNTVIIVNTEDLRGISLINEKKLPAITIGMTGKETITYTSVTDDGMVFCLNRAVKIFTGETLEPFEKPCIHLDKDAFVSLSVYGTLMLFNLL